MNKKSTLLLALALSAGTAFAQKQVTGHVSDVDGTPIQGASVRVEGVKQMVLTDANGNFKLTNVPTSAKKLNISYIGMKAVTVDIAGNVRIVLEDGNVLDEAMVVAYGTAKKSAYTGSASVVKGESLENRQVSDVTRALGGAVAGVQTVSGNGQPGTSATVRIRGFGSINAGMNPLYVVDNVPYDGDISAINPQDIEQMSILKDAAAAALYGARGANGVIMITTKKGKVGEARVTLDARWGVNSRLVKNYNVLTSPSDYMEKLYQSQYNGAIYNLGYSAAGAHTYANSKAGSVSGYTIYTVPSGETLFDTNGKINSKATLGYSDGTYYYQPDDWAKNTFSNELRQEYNLGISGGTENLSYYFSAGYLADDGVITQSGFDRITTRATVDYQAKPWLKVGTNLAYTNSTSKYPENQTTTNSSSNAFYIANYIAPIYPMFVRTADGALAYSATTGQLLYDYGDGSSTAFTRNWMSMSNPKGDLSLSTREYLMDIFAGKWYATLTPIEGLSLTAALGLNVDNTRFHSATSPYYGQSASSGGQAVQEHTRTYGLTQQYLANYRTEFGLNHLDFLLGYESYEYNTESSSAIGSNLYKEGDWAVNNTIDSRRGYGSVDSYATKGIIFRVNYDWDGKYYASFSMRRDGSSRFHPDHRWGTFWSVSAGWDLSKENFMKAYDWVNLLKLKASFGQQGNDNIGNYYAYLDQYSVTGSDGVFSDATLVYKGNKDLTWEKSNSFNIGVDFTLWKGLLGGSIEFFSRQTSDMLYYRPVAPSNGYSTIPMNVGSMRNSGVEFDLNSILINRENLRWTANLNATFLKNKIISLHPSLEGELIDGTRIYREGESMYQRYLVKYAGVDPATGLALYWAADKDADGNITREYATSEWDVAYSTNRQGTGDLLPTVSGGFGTTLEAYGFDLSIGFAYQLGGKIYDSGYQTLMHGGVSGSIGCNWHADIANAWTPTNIYTDVPRLDAQDVYANSTSTRWLISSDYLSINNITLGYTLPKHLTQRIALNSLRVYAAADNLALFTARKGLDPRQGYLSSTTAVYSALRTISFGVKLTF